MRSTFMGLETARRGMFTQQSALYTTGHNISNANTPGYSRQRVNFTQSQAFPTAAFNRPHTPGQMGTGVESGSIQRIRESYLDEQFRTENKKIGYFSTLSESMTKMEEVMNEPSESGLHSVLEKFWNSLQDLANHTENSGARDVVASSGQAVADTFNYYYDSLDRVKNDLGKEIGIKVTEINDIITKIDRLNVDISEVEPHGYLPNDLYDKRDKLVDELSKFVSIRVERVKPTAYGNADSTAEGIYDIEITATDGRSFAPPVKIISATKASGIVSVNYLQVDDGDLIPETMDNPILKVTVGKNEIPKNNFSGELAGLIESYGYNDGQAVIGHYPKMLENLNKLAEAFVNEFNHLHKQGYILGEDGTTNPKTSIEFFEYNPGNPAQSLKVRKEITDDPSKIAAGLNSGDSGDNKNAHILAELRNKKFTDYEYYKQPGNTLPEGLNGNLDTFYAGIIGKMGVQSQSFTRNLQNSQILAGAVEKNRESVSAVSLDEEMTNMIKFQHAYNAAARQLTVIDEVLDKIINGMGVVGR